MKLPKFLGAFNDRRRSPRLRTDRLCAVYWNGSAPVTRSVREISFDGAYIETPDAWYPGTMFQVQLVVRPLITGAETAEAGAEETIEPGNSVVDVEGAPEPRAESDGQPGEEPIDEPETQIAIEPPMLPPQAAKSGPHVSVMARVVRHVDGGMCVEFLYYDYSERRALRNLVTTVRTSGGATTMTASRSERLPARWKWPLHLPWRQQEHRAGKGELDPGVAAKTGR